MSVPGLELHWEGLDFVEIQERLVHTTEEVIMMNFQDFDCCV